MQRLDVKAAVREVSNTCYQLLPYRRPSESAISKNLWCNMADDENTNGAHEKGYRWQCKHIVCDIPGENLSVGHSVFFRHLNFFFFFSYQQCHRCLYQSHSSAVSSSHSNSRLECSWIGPGSQAAFLSIFSGLSDCPSLRYLQLEDQLIYHFDNFRA